MMYVIWAALTFASIQVRRKGLQSSQFEMKTKSKSVSPGSCLHLYLCTHSLELNKYLGNRFFGFFIQEKQSSQLISD